MIVVIADDLTGAAELGGLGLQYDLKVEVITASHLHSTADLLVISTDARSMEKQQAVEEMTKITSLVKKMKPALIYKKVDSVMRGHIAEELMAQIKVLNLPRALLIPANPALGRTIVDGIYFIHEQPVHESAFSSDPEFPVVDSRVLQMLRGNASFIRIKKIGEELPESGIIVGEARTSDDLKEWAIRADKKNTLLAGAAGFFTAILDTMHLSKKTNNEENALGQPRLFVCGSTFDKSRQSIKAIKKAGGPVSYMPSSFLRSNHIQENEYSEWCKEVVNLLTIHGKAIIAIEEVTTESGQASAKDLREITADIVSRVLKTILVPELIVEGGATASAIIRKQGFTKFLPVTEFTTGVIRMRVDGKENVHLTLKPGSYSWPAQIWNF